MPSSPVLTSGSVQRPALPGISAQMLGSDTADAEHKNSYGVVQEA